MGFLTTLFPDGSLGGGLVPTALVALLLTVAVAVASRRLIRTFLPRPERSRCAE